KDHIYTGGEYAMSRPIVLFCATMSQQILTNTVLEQKLKAYRLSGMVKTLETRLKQAESETLSYAEFLGLLLEDETNTRADHKRIQSYLKPDLLILDEFGYRSMADSTVEDFFEIVRRRYEKGSIIITSNKQVSEWDKVFIDKTLATAIIDRLIHHCSVIEIKG